jgi:hypothetical protein
MKDKLNDFVPVVFALLSAIITIVTMIVPDLSDTKANGAFNIALALASSSAGLAVSKEPKKNE